MNTRPPALAAISDGIAHLHMRFYGRGPTKTKTHIADDLAVCVVETATGRTVLAYMSLSQIHVDPNIAVELFMLEPSSPAGANATPRASASEDAAVQV